MLRLLVLPLLLGAVTVAHGQTFDQYLKLRRQYHISQPVGEQALETFVGSRTLEIKGTVKGTMSVAQGEMSLLLQKSDGGNLFVACPTGAPDWLQGNEIEVRLLVQAHRASANADIEASLIGAAGEEKMEAYEADHTVRSRPLTSRHATRDYRNEDYVNAEQAVPIYADFILSRNRRLGADEASRIAEGVIRYSLEYGVDARLIMAMIMVESGFNPNATSRTGAMGLGQLMPGTAAGMGVSNAYDTDQNLDGTVRLIRGHIDAYQRQTGEDYQSLVLALAAYNAGPGAVARHGGVPPYRETQNYVRKVISIYESLCGA